MAEIARQFPQLVTEIINLDEPGAEKPEEVFAVPTYLLNGKIISLGNPYPEQLSAKIMAVLTENG